MPTFKKSMYLERLALMNFCFSIDLEGSMPQMGQQIIRLGMLIGNFVNPLGLAFHNLIRGTFVGLRIKSMGKTLYCITGQPI